MNNQYNHKFLLRFAKIETLYALVYSALFYQMQAYFTSVVFLFTAMTLYPVVSLLSQRGCERCARFAIIIGGLVLIYSGIVGVRQDMRAELYYIPAMMLPLLLFGVHQKKEVVIGMTLPLLAWVMGIKEMVPALPSSWLPQHFPAETFEKINFLGAFAITAIFLNFYRQHLLGLNEMVSNDLEKLKSLSEHLYKSQHLAKIGSWELNLKTNRLLWSDEVFRIFEIDRDKFGASYEAFLNAIHPEDRDTVNKAYTNSLETKKPYEIAHRLQMPDGRIKFVREQCETHYDETGSPLYSIGTIQDITESHQNDALLHHSAKMASLGEMAGGIAHEINNPLTTILGKAHQTLKRVELDNYDKEDFASNLKKIISNVERISKIVNSLRAISRNADADPMELTFLQKIIEDSLELSSERFKFNGIELRVYCPPELAIMCRPSEIGQVILNLVNNACDAVMKLDEKWVEIKLVENAGVVKIHVIDSGKGIPDSVLDKLMYPFFTTKEVGKGTGLGLSISKQIIERHNGKLYYDRSSKNTSFIVELPLTISNSRKAA